MTVKDRDRKPTGLHLGPDDPCDRLWSYRKATAEELAALADRQCKVCLKRAAPKLKAEPAKPKPPAQKMAPARKPPAEVEVTKVGPQPKNDPVSEKARVDANLAAAKAPAKQEA
jgi:hypothetical protein